MLFPRMFSRAHAGLYQQWLGGIDTKPVEVHGQYDGQAYDFTGEMPSQWDNLRFFLSYQVNFMYWRYFMWNFAGRQNDIQSYGELDHGQWITGIPFIDNALYGDQSKLPADLRENKGHNVFYCLPLLLGLLGMFWQAYRGKKGIQQFWVVFFLFFMTGLAIILYLNQTPSEPRERDYAYAGSFYAFAIWIGLGIAALVEGLRRFGKLPISPPPASHRLWRSPCLCNGQPDLGRPRPLRSHRRPRLWHELSLLAPTKRATPSSSPTATTTPSPFGTAKTWKASAPTPAFATSPTCKPTGISTKCAVRRGTVPHCPSLGSVGSTSTTWDTTSSWCALS